MGATILQYLLGGAVKNYEKFLINSFIIYVIIMLCMLLIEIIKGII